MKSQRQEKLIELIKGQRLRTQEALVNALRRQGLAATQSAVSRDIAELGITKANGNYTLPQIKRGMNGLISVDQAGDALLVVKTETGQAQPVALRIDRASIPEIVGTIAGDDTIFVAVRQSRERRGALRRMVELFAK